jgi:5-methylcytosine-specific restriction endonuclease McrA
MSNVFVVDTNKKPLNPVHPGRARLLLKQGKAAVFRRYPFTILLKKPVESPQLDPLRLKLDPGSQTTGIALVNDATGQVVWAAELHHRGQTIKLALDHRRAIRRSRRNRKTRYRQPRFQNRRRKKEWLPPSLASRLANVLTWVARLMRWCPITAISLELVKFDTQLLENPEISGVQYQQGTLAGYELREHLLEKWGRQCAYCDAKDVPLQVEHLLCRARGGSNRTSNLTLACGLCNITKGTQDIREFLKQQPERLARILAHSSAPLKDAAAVNATRWALYERLQATGLPVECGSGGLTKYHRVTLNLPKAHWVDAACVGKHTPESLQVKDVQPLLISATGSGKRQMCSMNCYGFPRTGPKQAKKVKGFQTGDLVRARVPTGKYAGVHIGRVLVRASGSFDIRTKQGRVQGMSHHFCTLLHRGDGYSYQQGEAV